MHAFRVLVIRTLRLLGQVFKSTDHAAAQASGVAAATAAAKQQFELDAIQQAKSEL